MTDMTTEYTLTKRRFKYRDIYVVKAADGAKGEIEDMGNGYRSVFGSMVGSKLRPLDEAVAEVLRCSREARARICFA
jgi:hypothetical protein